MVEQVIDYTALNEVTPEEGAGVFGTLGAAFRQSTSIGSLMAGEAVDRADIVGGDRENRFTLEDVRALPEHYQPFRERFIGLTQEGAAAMRRNIDGELRDREIIDRAGFVGGFAADLAVQFVDPINYVPFANSTYRGMALSTRIARGARDGLVGAALQEPILYASQETRTIEESFANVGASVVFGSIIGGATHVVDMGRARWGAPADATLPRSPEGAVAAVDIDPLVQTVRSHIYDQRVASGAPDRLATHDAELFAAAFESTARQARAADPDFDVGELARVYQLKVELAGKTPEGEPDAAAITFSQSARDDVSVEATSVDAVDVVVSGEVVGRIDFRRTDDGATRIFSTEILEGFRRRGIGRAAYEKFVGREIEAGRVVESDAIVRDGAAAIYDGLSGAGFTVEKSPDAVRAPRDKVTTIPRERRVVLRDGLNDADIRREFPPVYRVTGRNLKQDARGQITLPSGGPRNGATVIRLMEGEDASTFMHESAHFFLEIMADIDATMGAKSPFRDDLRTIRRWAGVTKKDGFTRDAHEKFARGFEQYLRTGKAPKPALERAFEAFKEWLIKVYASAADLDVDVSPEMARVYDRMLVPDVSEMDGAYPAPKSASASALGDAAIIDPETGEYRAATASDYALRNKAARLVERTGLNLTANSRTRRSPLAALRGLMGNLVEDMRDSEASRQGVIGAAVETLVKNDRGLVEAKLYDILGMDGRRVSHPSMDQDEFNSRVMNAIANPDGEPDMAVKKLADELHGRIIAPLEKQMRAVGMLAEAQKWSADGRYAPHNWSAQRVLENLGAWRGKMGARVRSALEIAYQKDIQRQVQRQRNILREIDELERGGLRRKDDMARRFNGDEVDISEADLRSLIMQARNRPDDKRPTSLRDFVVNRGGLWLGDAMAAEFQSFDFRRPGFTKRNRFQRSAAGDNGGGLPLDEMREAAAEAGYIDAEADLTEFLDRLGEDISGRRQYSQEDLNEVEAWNAYDEFVESLEAMGIDPSGRQNLRASTGSQREMMQRTLEAMDRIDAVRIDDLRGKYAEAEAEADRSVDALGSDADMAAEVGLILDDIQAKITREDQIWSEDMSLTVERAGPLNRRTIDVKRSEFSEFMDNDPLNVIGRHMHRMISEYHLTKRFGRADLKHDIASLQEEAKRYGAGLSGKERVEFDRQLEKDVAMLQVTRDQVRGTHLKGQTGATAEAARFASASSYTLQLGDVVTSSLGDSMRPLMAHGAGHLLRHGFPRFLEGIRQLRGLWVDAGEYINGDRAGVVVERVTSSRMLAMMELDDEYHPNSKATRFANNMAGWATRISGMDRWNQMGKWISSGLFMDRLGEMSARGWDELSAADQNYLSINRISQFAWPHVAESIRQHGTKSRGIWSLNLEKWGDGELATITRAAMRKDADSVIVTPGFGDRIQSIGGADMTGAVGRMLLQYKSFWISGHERIMLRYAQNPHIAATASGALAMALMGMFIDEVKAFTGGYELSDNIGTRIMGGIDRSGLIPLWMEVNNILERGASLPLAYRAAGGVGQLLGAEDAGGTATRYQSRNVLGSFLGPSAGVVGDVQRVTGDLIRETRGIGDGVTPGTVSAAKRLIPFQNAPVMRELLNWWLVPAAREALG